MGYFVKRSVLDETGTTGQLIRINMTENGNLMHLKNVKVSAAAKEKKKNFLKEHKTFFIGIVKNLQEKNPPRSFLVRLISAAIPTKMSLESHG